jgi:hypothetical protein
MTPNDQKTTRKRFTGFRRAAQLVARPVREVGESRGFAVSRLLTHWAEIAGEGLATHTRPVEVSYGRGGLGATLTILTTGANAPMVEMQKEKLRERVNACYGYAAISRVRVTQTAATGFAEGQAVFAPAPAPPEPKGPAPEARAAAARVAAPVSDPSLRDALEKLGANVISRQQK